MTGRWKAQDASARAAAAAAARAFTYQKSAAISSETSTKFSTNPLLLKRPQRR